jgi:hypothetical protein
MLGDMLMADGCCGMCIQYHHHSFLHTNLTDEHWPLLLQSVLLGSQQSGRPASRTKNKQCMQ